MTVNKQASKTTSTNVEEESPVEEFLPQVGQVEIPSARVSALDFAIRSIGVDPRAGSFNDLAGEVVGRAARFHEFLCGEDAAAAVPAAD